MSTRRGRVGSACPGERGRCLMAARIAGFAPHSNQTLQFQNAQLGRLPNRINGLGVVQGRLNRIGKVLRTGEAYELRGSDGKPISAAEGRAMVAERFSIPAEIRNARRR